MLYNKYIRYLPQYTSDNFNNKNRGMKQSKFVLLSYHHTHIPKCLAIIWNRLTIRNSHCFRIAKCTWYQDRCTYYYVSIDILSNIYDIIFICCHFTPKHFKLKFLDNSSQRSDISLQLAFLFIGSYLVLGVNIYLSINREKGNFHYHL